MIAALFLSMALLQIKVPDAAQFVGAPQGTPLTGAQLERRTMEISSELRCPVCQGLAIGDSPSQMAANMKAQVRELLERGYTEEQILSYFEKSYGQFVLLKPKFQGVNALVWILPLLALAGGFVLVVTKAKNLEKTPVQVVAGPEPADDPYLARVREMVDKQ
jgi:cytochrome c-type biogenesis protein CcmH